MNKARAYDPHGLMRFLNDVYDRIETDYNARSPQRPFSQEEFARHLGMSAATISRYRRGKPHPPKELTLRQIADVLKVPFVDLWTICYPDGTIQDVDVADLNLALATASPRQRREAIKAAREILRAS